MPLASHFGALWPHNGAPTLTRRIFSTERSYEACQLPLESTWQALSSNDDLASNFINLLIQILHQRRGIMTTPQELLIWPIEPPINAIHRQIFKSIQRPKLASMTTPFNTLDYPLYGLIAWKYRRIRSHFMQPWLPDILVHPNVFLPIWIFFHRKQIVDFWPLQRNWLINITCGINIDRHRCNRTSSFSSSTRSFPSLLLGGAISSDDDMLKYCESTKPGRSKISIRK